MYTSILWSTSSKMITVYLFLSASMIGSYFSSIIPNAGAEPQLFEVGPNSTTTTKNSHYENSTLGIQIEYPAHWKTIEKTSAATNATVVEFVPIVESEHDPLTPFFSISIEDLNEIKMSQNVGNESQLSIGSNNSSSLNVLNERNLRLVKSLPDYNIIGLNSTAILSGIPAYEIVYTFADPGSPLHPLFESMNIWTIQDGKVYTVSYSASESEFSNHLQTMQNMIDSFMIRKNH